MLGGPAEAAPVGASLEAFTSVRWKPAGGVVGAAAAPFFPLAALPGLTLAVGAAAGCSAAGAGVPGPRGPAGDALPLDLPAVPVRPLADYAIGALS